MNEIQTITTAVTEKELCPGEIEGYAKMLFSDNAYLYIVLDSEVVMGIFRNREFRICLVSGKKISSVPWEYVQEFRIFNHSRELRLMRFQNRFCGRLREDGGDGRTAYIMDESQKIWGSAKRSEDGFHLLTSTRGSRIWVPEIIDNTGRIEWLAGVRVRTYIDFPPASEKRGLYLKEDVRFLGICPWPWKGGKA